jgi:hypothetical protein
MNGCNQEDFVCGRFGEQLEHVTEMTQRARADSTLRDDHPVISAAIPAGSIC